MVKAASKKAPTRGATPLPQKSSRQWQLRLPKMAWQWLVYPIVVLLLLVAGQASYKRWPIQEVEIQGRLLIWQPEQIAEPLIWVKEEHFFTVDLARIQQQVSDMPLIAHVQVRKRWPGRIELRVFEDVPMARWGDNALVTVSENISAIPVGYDASSLAVIDANEDHLELALRSFRHIQQTLVHPDVTVQVVSLQVGDTGSIRVHLDNDWQVEFGRQYFEERVRRLDFLLQRLPQDDVATIDLRYGKGAAVAWHPSRENG
ncbi:MAG: FtsQ-type POTRA domain-containing protein [Bacterioplanes sp.]|nr:FtsQ-type POTRA domain-containing protein [Bacterioplanes sp.]